MKVAFYKGTRQGLAGIYNRGVRLVTKGKYSHCELIFSDGMSASSSFMDGGVRFKNIKYDLTNWDIVDVGGSQELVARKWFEDHEGEKYDLIGNIHFLFPMIGDNRHRWSCAEAVAASLSIFDAWRLHPNSLNSLLKSFYAIDKRN